MTDTILFVNNGLNRIKIDDVNYGSGFNLNLICLQIVDSGGQN